LRKTSASTWPSRRGPGRPPDWLAENWHRALAHAAGLLPLAWLALIFLGNPGSFTFNRTFMLRTGTAGLVLLAASLACSPAGSLLRWPRATQMRRTLGLYAFLHICLHLYVYAVRENGLDWGLIWRDLGERPAMTAGLLAFLVLIPLAATSTRGWQRRLGRRWKALHRLVYAAAGLSVLHFLLLDRDFITEPLLFALVIGLLLAARLPWSRWLSRPPPPQSSS
jgi:sulfoxide reductase heme-binding subunit YedZ